MSEIEKENSNITVKEAQQVDNCGLKNNNSGIIQPSIYLHQNISFFTAFKNMIMMLILFLICAFIVYRELKNMPGLSDVDKKILLSKIPNNFSDRGKLADMKNLYTLFEILQNYKEQNSVFLIFLLSSLYLLYQSFPLFMIWCPGIASSITIFFGALYGWKNGVIICITLSTVGPSLAYHIFKKFGYSLAVFFLKKKLLKVEKLMINHTSSSFDLITYLVFLRVSPLFPNFFINIAAPVLNIPFSSFLIGTFIGLLPNTLILISIGEMLNENMKLAELNWRIWVFSTLIGVLVLLPKIGVYILRKYILLSIGNIEKNNVVADFDKED